MPPGAHARLIRLHLLPKWAIRTFPWSCPTIARPAPKVHTDQTFRIFQNLCLASFDGSFVFVAIMQRMLKACKEKVFQALHSWMENQPKAERASCFWCFDVFYFDLFSIFLIVFMQGLEGNRPVSLKEDCLRGLWWLLKCRQTSIWQMPRCRCHFVEIFVDLQHATEPWQHSITVQQYNLNVNL